MSDADLIKLPRELEPLMEDMRRPSILSAREPNAEEGYLETGEILKYLVVCSAWLFPDILQKKIHSNLPPKTSSRDIMRENESIYRSRWFSTHLLS